MADTPTPAPGRCPGHPRLLQRGRRLDRRARPDPPGAGQPVAGICNVRGVNAYLPRLGAMGRHCVIEDPAGAIAALVEPPLH